MTMLIRILLVMLMLLSRNVSADTLEVLSRAADSKISITLSNTQRQWLANKVELKVGVYLPDRPPLDITANQKDYEGLSADYLDVIARGLGVHLDVEHFGSKALALQALQRGEIDVVPRINHLEAVYADLMLSAPYSYDQAVLITKFGAHWTDDQVPAGTTVLFDSDWIQKERVAAMFPKLPIESVQSTENGLGMVAYGEGMVLLTDAISAQYLLERSYHQSLALSILRGSEGLGFSFAVRRENNQLRTLLNNTLSNILPVERATMARHWGVGANPKLSSSRLQFTAAERKWIKDHPQIDVLANDLYSPFSFFNTEGQLRGMAADLLELINDRTGLVFHPTKISSVEAMTSRTEHGPPSLIGALTYSSPREERIAFSRPYLINPFVLVTRVQPEHEGLSKLKGLRVAIIKNSAAASWLAREWPDIKVEEVDTPIETYELLVEGQVEGVIQPQLGASYLIDRFFRGRLQIDSVIGSPPALISFASGKQNAELISIINKALLDISPDEFSSLANRWQNAQEGQGDWGVYRKWLLRVTLGMILMLLVFVTWNLGLRRQIAERLKVQKALNDQLVFMKVLLDGTPHPLYVRDRMGLLITCNRAYLQAMEVELDQILGKGLIEANILATEDAWSYKRIHRATLESGEPSFDNFTMTVGNKTYHIYHWALPYRDSSGTMTGVIGGWIDLTEQTHLQHALHRAKDQAEAANRGKSHFLAVMSHEIRTPMSALIGVLELMRDKQSTPDLIDIAQKSANGMMELIGEILDLSKIESGKFELRSSVCHPVRLVSTVMQGFASLAQRTDVTLKWKTHGPEISVELDSLRLRQIVSNLLSNAIKFTPQGTVMLDLSIVPNDDSANLRLRIRDTGIGMSEEQCQQLFQPYTQFESGETEFQSGTGLGLAICQQLTELMGGRLTCESKPGLGSCFTLELNAAIVDIEEAEAIPAIEDLPPLPARNFLIVEDHEFNRVVLQRQLESLGMHVTCAEHGVEGLQLLGRNTYDYVITDCNMPQMSGGQMTRELRILEARDGRTATHVVGLTANAQAQEILSCLDDGMNDCLFKPVTRLALESYLRKVEQAQLSSVPCFDIAMIHNITGGDAVANRELLAMVLRTNKEDCVSLQKLYAAGDFNSMTKSCHKILGSARIIHASHLISACEQLESACAEPFSPEQLGALYQACIKQMQLLENSIKHHMSNEFL